MGLSSKQVSSDHHWGQTSLESSESVVDLPKPPPPQPSSRRQQQNNNNQQAPPPEPLKCPRCSSMNTKFCYYNNYNKSQPRHFCKACKRHWTKGGTLRNVPVGGGRKNKRLKVSPPSNINTATSAAATATPPAATTKNLSDALFRAVMNNPTSISEDSINTFSGKTWINSNKNNTFPMLSLPVDQTLPPFSFSSLSPFDTIPGFYTGELDHVESTSTITTVTPGASSAGFSHHSWQGGGGGGAAETPNYWNWINDVDPLASSDLNISSWDDILMKP